MTGCKWNAGILVHSGDFEKSSECERMLRRMPLYMVVILHNIRSLHNVGSIFRTADAVGVEKLYLCGITPSPLDRFGVVRSDVAKVALGAEKTVVWEQVSTTARCITMLRKQGFAVVALEQDPRAIPYDAYGTNPSPAKAGTPFRKGRIKPIALVLGAEVEGISPAVLKNCDTIIEIPMRGKKESLNVAVAFGVAAFRLRDDRE